MNSKKILRFAVVGCGNIGTRHLAVLDETRNAQVAAYCDIKNNKLESLSSLYPDADSYLSYSELLKDETIDVVSICTPHYLHSSMAIEAMEAGKHVLVEKPMCLNRQESELMIAKAVECQKHLVVVKQNRYNVPVNMVRKLIDENKLGQIYMVNCNVLWNRNVEYYNHSDWRGDKLKEGGALYTQASHFVDLLVWWFGDVVSAKTQLRRDLHDVNIEDGGSSVVEFSSGVLGSFNWTTCVYNKNYEGSITIIGEKGTVKIGGQYLNKIDYWDVQSCPMQEGVEFIDKPNMYGKYQGTSSNHDKVINDMIALLHKEENHSVHGEEALRTVDAIELMYKGTWLEM